ncbi:hypothetical protein OAK55_01320 [Akkermansiaceae bacterium]|nr:hypothetical protein [Akkermansiaceae bacterium]
MPDTSGLSFYITAFLTPSTAQTLNYGFQSLVDDDITVVFINGSNTRLVLTKGDHYTLNTTTQEVTCTAATWISLSVVSGIVDSSSKIRIFRTTSIQPSVDFKSGAVLSEGDLDTAYKQGLFAAQEMAEDAAATSAGVQAVTENMLETGAVTATKIGANAVTESRILNSAVTNAKIADNAVNAAKIQNGTVGSDELAANCVTSAKIGANQVTSAQIADNSIGYTEISNASASAVKAAVETEAASSPITPDVLRYSPFSPRCYGSISYDGNTPTIASGSFNVTSVTEPSANVRAITFATALDSTDYVVIATRVVGTNIESNAVMVSNKSVSGFNLFVGTPGDETGSSLDFVVFGSTLS